MFSPMDLVKDAKPLGDTAFTQADFEPTPQPVIPPEHYATPPGGGIPKSYYEDIYSRNKVNDFEVEGSNLWQTTNDTHLQNQYKKLAPYMNGVKFKYTNDQVRFAPTEQTNTFKKGAQGIGQTELNEPTVYINLNATKSNPGSGWASTGGKHSEFKENQQQHELMHIFNTYLTDDEQNKVDALYKKFKDDPKAYAGRNITKEVHEYSKYDPLEFFAVKLSNAMRDYRQGYTTPKDEVSQFYGDLARSFMEGTHPAERTRNYTGYGTIEKIKKEESTPEFKVMEGPRRKNISSKKPVEITKQEGTELNPDNISFTSKF